MAYSSGAGAVAGIKCLMKQLNLALSPCCPKLPLKIPFPFEELIHFSEHLAPRPQLKRSFHDDTPATLLRMTNDASFIPTSERSSEGWMSRRMGERKRWDFIPYAMGGLLSDMAVSMIIIIFTIILVPFPISQFPTRIQLF